MPRSALTGGMLAIKPTRYFSLLFATGPLADHPHRPRSPATAAGTVVDLWRPRAALDRGALPSSCSALGLAFAAFESPCSLPSSPNTVSLCSEAMGASLGRTTGPKRSRHGAKLTSPTSSSPMRGP